MDEGYGRRDGDERVGGAEEARSGTGQTFAHVALNSPNGRQLRALAKKLGFDEKTQVQDVLHAGVGDTGCAMSLMSLVAALERAKSGEKILLASYGNGCDVVFLETTERIGTLRTGGASGNTWLPRAPAQLQPLSALARTGHHAAAGPPAARAPHALAGGPVAGSALGVASDRHASASAAARRSTRRNASA